MVSGYHVASRTGLLVLDNSAGTEGTGPMGVTETHLTATAGLSSAALRSWLLLGLTREVIPQVELTWYKLLEHG